MIIKQFCKNEKKSLLVTGQEEEKTSLPYNNDTG